MQKVIIQNIEISNPNKIVFEKEKIKKIDIVKYYDKVSNLMFPYLKNRLLSVVRCTGKGSCFFKKHQNLENENIAKFFYKNDEYFYVLNKSGIIFEAQMGTVEFHTIASCIDNIEKPNFMVFDLDPDENLDINLLRQAVKNLKSVLDDLDLISFLKTSGGKGYHIVLPFISECNYDKFENFSFMVAKLAETKWPNLFTTNIRKKDRKGKIFIDYLRNSESATCVAPYCIRAKEDVRVSMPIKWSELDKVSPNEITMELALKRIKNKNPWQEFFNINQIIK